MKGTAKTYDALRAYCETVPLVDCHDHAIECGPNQKDALEMFANGYFQSDLLSASSDAEMAVLADAKRLAGRALADPRTGVAARAFHRLRDDGPPRAQGILRRDRPDPRRASADAGQAAELRGRGLLRQRPRKSQHRRAHPGRLARREESARRHAQADPARAAGDLAARLSRGAQLRGRAGLSETSSGGRSPRWTNTSTSAGRSSKATKPTARSPSRIRAPTPARSTTAIPRAPRRRPSSTGLWKTRAAAPPIPTASNRWTTTSSTPSCAWRATWICRCRFTPGTWPGFATTSSRPTRLA